MTQEIVKNPQPNIAEISRGSELYGIDMIAIGIDPTDPTARIHDTFFEGIIPSDVFEFRQIRTIARYNNSYATCLGEGEGAKTFERIVQHLESINTPHTVRIVVAHNNQSMDEHKERIRKAPNGSLVMPRKIPTNHVDSTYSVYWKRGSFSTTTKNVDYATAERLLAASVAE